MSHKHQILVLTASLVLPSLTLIGCATPADSVNCDNGRCDVPDEEVPDSPCDGIITDHSGGNHAKVAGRNQDALSKLVFQKGANCPTNFQDIMAKLREEDKEGCADERAGIQTRFVSETAQASGKATNYRTVTTRKCANRGANSIIFSGSARAGATTMPKAVEIIAFDETAGVYNFYDSDGSSLNFFGSSTDLLKGTGDDRDTRRCAGCHVGGGLIMKELDSPWINWEGHIDHPGAKEVVDNIKDLGSKTTGIEFEGLVNSANDKWNTVRVNHLKDGDKAVANLLKPLFCTVEINLANGASFASPIIGGRGGDEMSSVPLKSLLDPQLKGFGSIPITFTDYDDLIKANGQVVDGLAGAIDTIIDYTFVQRGHIDNDFVNKLKAAGIVDDDLIKDVLMVDFTRPIFSDDRCGLLTFAPDLSGADLTAAKIRDGFIANLEAESPVAGSPAATLLANLKDTADATTHTAKVDAFINACKALGSKPFMTNALTITSLNRTKARGLPVIEFGAAFPSDNLNVDPAARLHPTTCQLTNDFVAP